jgi:hypothetical protein
VLLNELINGFQGARKNPATLQAISQNGLVGPGKATALNPGIGEFALRFLAKKKDATDRRHEFFSMSSERPKRFEGSLFELLSARKQLGSYSEVESCRVEMD